VTLTCCPAAVVIVKLDVDTALTVPAAPPSAGPDRALDAPPPDPKPLAEPLAAATFPVVAEGDLVRPTENPITAHISAPAAAITVHRVLLFESHRRIERRGRSSRGIVGS
jgi:hypothetical protein